jgi:hypothetical protein
VVEQEARAADHEPVRLLRLPTSLVVLLAGAALAAGCGGSPAQLDPLASAAERTADAGSARFEMRMAMTVAGRSAEATASGAFDNESRRATMSMDLSALAGAFGGGAGALRMDMVMDGTVAYMRMPLLTAQLPGGKPWVKLDLEELAGREGLDLGELQSLSDNDPRRTLDYLRAVSGEIRTVGREAVRGVPTTHYRAAVNLRKYPDLVPEDQRKLVQEAMDRLIAQVGLGAVPVDVWVDGEGLVRRMRIAFDVAGAGGAASSTVTMELFDYGTPVAVQLPSPAEVTDLAAFLPSS